MLWHGIGGIAAIGLKGPQGHESTLGVSMPRWAVAAVRFVVAAFTGWRLWQRRARCTAAMRATCGYDPRAWPDRCPECGTPVPTPAGAASKRGEAGKAG